MSSLRGVGELHAVERVAATVGVVELPGLAPDRFPFAAESGAEAEQVEDAGADTGPEAPSPQRGETGGARCGREGWSMGIRELLHATRRDQLPGRVFPIENETTVCDREGVISVNAGARVPWR